MVDAAHAALTAVAPAQNGCLAGINRYKRARVWYILLRLTLGRIVGKGAWPARFGTKRGAFGTDWTRGLCGLQDGGEWALTIA